MSLTGLNDPDKDRRMMIGQRLKATLSGLPDGRSPTYARSISGSQPYNGFAPTQANAQVKSFPCTAASMVCFFAKKEDNGVIVTCTITMANPSTTVTVSSDKFIVQEPNIFHDRQSIGSGMVGDLNTDKNSPSYNLVTPDTTDPNFFGLYGATYPNHKPWGIYYNVWVEDQPGYIGAGSFTFTQLVTDETKATLNDGTTDYVQGKRGIGLDTAYPYPNLPYQTAYTHPQDSTTWPVFPDRPHLSPSTGTLKQSFKGLSYNAKFRLYVFYQGGDDDAGAGDVVPVRLIPWNFVSAATYGGTQWSVANDPSNTIGTSTEYPAYPDIMKWPSWSQVIP